MVRAFHHYETQLDERVTSDQAGGADIRIRHRATVREAEDDYRGWSKETITVPLGPLVSFDLSSLPKENTTVDLIENGQELRFCRIIAEEGNGIVSFRDGGDELQREWIPTGGEYIKRSKQGHLHGQGVTQLQLMVLTVPLAVFTVILSTKLPG